MLREESEWSVRGALHNKNWLRLDRCDGAQPHANLFCHRKQSQRMVRNVQNRGFTYRLKSDFRDESPERESFLVFATGSGATLIS